MTTDDAHRADAGELLAAALAERGIEEKIARVVALAADWTAGRLKPYAGTGTAPAPGWPPDLVTVDARAVLRRPIGTMAGRAALIHAVAHIEFSAINLALDHALRFGGLPPEYYGDWISVAADEARHFAMLRKRLREFGHDYGDFPVHGGLWQMAEKTGRDALARMALVPRLLEARGLDATPPMRARLAQAGDEETAGLLDVILRDEIRHVAIGDHWFRHLCAERELDPESGYRRLIAEYAAPWPQAPFNEAARLAAGFTAGELAELAAGAPAGKA